MPSTAWKRPSFPPPPPRSRGTSPRRRWESEQRKYELGTGTIFLVLEAETELAATETTLVQAQINYQMALTAADHATGTLLERHHVQLEQSGVKQL